MSRILFISHNATLTGAPMILLNLVKWLKENTSIEPTIFINEVGYDNGPLFKEFSEVAETYLVEKMTDHELYNLLYQKKIDLILSNTIVNIHLLNKILNVAQVPHICYVHELENVIRECVGLKENMQWLDENTSHFIACSSSVKENLIQNNKIDAAKITVIQEFIQLKNYDFNKINSETNLVRKKLGISENTIVLGMVGALQYRKGFDLIIPIANALKSKKIDFRVVMVGVDKSTDPVMHDRICADIEKSDLADNFSLIAPDINIDRYYNLFTIFLMLSREDPFPLVNLHAASFGSPIICFSNAGGSPDFVGTDSGFVVKYLNLEEMAEKTHLLIQNPALRKKLGQAAKLKVEQKNNVEVQCPKIYGVIQEVLKSAVQIKPQDKNYLFQSEASLHSTTHNTENFRFIVNNNISKENYEERFAVIKDWYHDQYEVLPSWYKKLGHIIKILTGKKTIKSYLNK